MILFTPASVRRWASALTIPATSVANLTLRGRGDRSASPAVVTPMMPICWPPLSTTTESAIRPLSRSACSTGSPLKSVLAVRNGTPLRSPAMNCARRVGPKSYSWLPIVIAS